MKIVPYLYKVKEPLLCLETCKIVTCFEYSSFQNTDGVEIHSYYLSNNHHYFAFTFILCCKICNFKTLSFLHQIKLLWRNKIKIKAVCNSVPKFDYNEAVLLPCTSKTYDNQPPS